MLSAKLLSCSLAVPIKFAPYFCFSWKFFIGYAYPHPNHPIFSAKERFGILALKKKIKKSRTTTIYSYGSFVRGWHLIGQGRKRAAAILIWNATEYFLKAGSHYFYRPVMSYVLSISLLFWPLLYALLLWSKCFVRRLHSLASALYQTQLIHRSVTFHWCTGV